jgi:hypothetical protein
VKSTQGKKDLMKKRIAAIACAAALMLALPTLAWAAPSPSGNNETGNVGGITVTVKAENGTVSAPVASDKPAKTVPEGVTPLMSFVVDGTGTNVTFSFNVGSQYANHAFTVYVEHGNGEAGENITGVVASDGTLTFTAPSLSIFSVVIGDVVSSSTANTGSTSPQTGIDLGTVAGATVVTAIAAGAVFVALRKKVTE